MRIFVIEADGGEQMTDGSNAHFTVDVDGLDQAFDLMRHSKLERRYEQFELIEEPGELEAGEPSIVAESESTTSIS